MSTESSIQIEECSPQKFSLVVIFSDQRFECGFYINRAEAMKAGKLFIDRKLNEQVSQKKRPRKK